jgi:hypothetical protein
VEERVFVLTFLEALVMGACRVAECGKQQQQ